MGWLLWASGRHLRSLYLSIVIAALVISTCLAGLPYGPKGVAIGFSAAMMLWLVPHVVWCLHGTTIAPLDIFWAASRPLLSAIVAVSLAYAAHVLSALQSPFTRLVVDGGVMMVVYAGMLLFVMGQKSAYLELLKAIGTISSPSSDAKDVENVSIHH
jgi:PST family polysaccharide transporter